MTPAIAPTYISHPTFTGLGTYWVAAAASAAKAAPQSPTHFKFTGRKRELCETLRLVVVSSPGRIHGTRTCCQATQRYCPVKLIKLIFSEPAAR